MTVKNITSVTLEILGRGLYPNESQEYPETMFPTLDIHSEIGSCVITTENGKKKFRNFGRLVAAESYQKNRIGMRDILISDIG